MITRKQYITNGAVLIIAFSTILFYGLSSGVTGVTQKNGNGCTCHSLNASSQVTVTITGPDQLQPNETGNYTLTIAGGPNEAGGVNIAVSSGTLTALTGLQKVNDELTHTSPQASSGGVVTFNFSYTAPAATGQVIIFAAGNSVNLNGSFSGDAWSFGQKTITLSPATDVEDEFIAKTFRLNQNYPNPFNPSTTISFDIPEDASGSLATLKIYDLLGKEVADLLNESRSSGRYEIKFDAAKLNSGVYIYQLKAGSYSDIKKMILMK